MLKSGVVSGWVVATLVLFIVACSSGDKDSTVDDRMIRITGEVIGVLAEQDGCLRLAQDSRPDSPSKAIVWQKDVFEIERSDNELRIVDVVAVEFGSADYPVVWKFGERIRASGGHYSTWERFASEEFLQRCAAPYVFVSMAERDSEPVLSE